MRKIFIAQFAVCLLIFFSGIGVARADAPKEYYVKAAILYKFIQFVEWPQRGTSINICIMGTDPFGDALQLIEKQSAQISIIRNVADSMAPRCSILFISRSEDYRLAQILQNVSSSPVLTVSEGDDFINKGGMVGFVTTNKVNFEINNAAVRRASLRIDARVLELALNVIDK